MGIGCYAVCPSNQKIKKFSKHMGAGTNNIAELLAMKYAMELIKKDPECVQVMIYSDSEYAIGCCDPNKGWNPTANQEYIAMVKEQMNRFHSVHFHWVKGHNKHPENEIVDKLAYEAARTPGLEKYE